MFSVPYFRCPRDLDLTESFNFSSSVPLPFPSVILRHGKESIKKSCLASAILKKNLPFSFIFSPQNYHSNLKITFMQKPVVELNSKDLKLNRIETGSLFKTNNIKFNTV